MSRVAIAIYPKTYATIVERCGEMVRAVDDLGHSYTLSIRWRNGYGPSGSMVPGQRIKVYRRPGCPHVNFRMVGS